MRKAGKDTKAIEEMIGRTSIKVDDIYTTIDSEQQADAVKAIPDALRLPMSLRTDRRADCGGGVATPRVLCGSLKGVGGRKAEPDKT